MIPIKSKIIKKKTTSEYSLQSEAFKKYGLIKPNLKNRIISINNNSANAIRGARNKKMGVMAGISDMIMLLDDMQIVFIEWKTQIGKQSQHQMLFEMMLKSIGHKYHVVRSIQEFIAVLNKYESHCTKKLFYPKSSIIKPKKNESSFNQKN
jgi:hypothetical protein